MLYFVCITLNPTQLHNLKTRNAECDQYGPGFKVAPICIRSWPCFNECITSFLFPRMPQSKGENDVAEPARGGNGKRYYSRRKRAMEKLKTANQ